MHCPLLALTLLPSPQKHCPSDNQNPPAQTSHWLTEAQREQCATGQTLQFPATKCVPSGQRQASPTSANPTAQARHFPGQQWLQGGVQLVKKTIAQGSSGQLTGEQLLAARKLAESLRKSALGLVWGESWECWEERTNREWWRVQRKIWESQAQARELPEAERVMAEGWSGRVATFCRSLILPSFMRKNWRVQGRVVQAGVGCVRTRMGQVLSSRLAREKWKQFVGVSWRVRGSRTYWVRVSGLRQFRKGWQVVIWVQGQTQGLEVVKLQSIMYLPSGLIAFTAPMVELLKYSKIPFLASHWYMLVCIGEVELPTIKTPPSTERKLSVDADPTSIFCTSSLFSSLSLQTLTQLSVQELTRMEPSRLI